jgi:hypothetical protein
MGFAFMATNRIPEYRALMRTCRLYDFSLSRNSDLSLDRTLERLDFTLDGQRIRDEHEDAIPGLYFR